MRKSVVPACEVLRFSGFHQIRSIMKNNFKSQFRAAVIGLALLIVLGSREVGHTRSGHGYHTQFSEARSGAESVEADKKVYEFYSPNSTDEIIVVTPLYEKLASHGVSLEELIKRCEQVFRTPFNGDATEVKIFVREHRSDESSSLNDYYVWENSKPYPITEFAIVEIKEKLPRWEPRTSLEVIIGQKSARLGPDVSLEDILTRLGDPEVIGHYYGSHYTYGWNLKKDSSPALIVDGKPKSNEITDWMAAWFEDDKAVRKIISTTPGRSRRRYDRILDGLRNIAKTSDAAYPMGFQCETFNRSKNHSNA
ncbi:MAG: hypothetical protein ACYS8Z_25190, partial [Planctomycetota bacterium]